MPFADVSDLESRWRVLSDEEQARATALLGDASAILAASVKVDEADEQQAALLKTVCCSMVIRAMSASESDNFGTSSMSITAGPYSQSFNYSNPSGDMYLTRMEKKLLGISGSGKGRTIMYGMAGDGDEGN